MVLQSQSSSKSVMDNSFLHSFQGAKVLVTGHSGFKGSWLTLLLHQLGAHVYGFSNSIPTSPSLFEQSNVNSFLLSNNLEFEITDSVSLLESVNLIEPDYIFHLAAQPIVATSITFPALTWSSNEWEPFLYLMLFANQIKVISAF